MSLEKQKLILASLLVRPKANPFETLENSKNYSDAVLAEDEQILSYCRELGEKPSHKAFLTVSSIDYMICTFFKLTP